MFILFEDKPELKLGKVISLGAGYLQVQTIHGKQQKIKDKALLYSWEGTEPKIETLMAFAESMAKSMDTHFLWESAPDNEFSASDFALDYFGKSPTLIEKVALLLALRASPIFFRRLGGALFRKAPSEQVEAALSGAERRAAQEAWIAQLTEKLIRYELPENWAQSWQQILWIKQGQPTPEQKALYSAAKQCACEPEELLRKCQAFATWEDFHVRQCETLDYQDDPHWQSELPNEILAPLINALPLGKVNGAVFSIDDASTDEIDDAFSVDMLTEGYRLGIHIAAPSLAFEASPLAIDHFAKRISTVYWPGNKWAMMGKRHGNSWADVFSLDRGQCVPVVSLFITLDAHFQPIAHETCCHRLTIHHNLRLHEIESVFNASVLPPSEDSTKAPINLPDDFPERQAFNVLWQFAQNQLAKRTQAGANTATEQMEYRFEIIAGRVNISERPRGAPLDALIAEMMIYANVHWSTLLRDHQQPAIYRVKDEGKVGFSTLAGAHKSMGVECYGWLTSPLRRMVDLCNQRSLIAQLQGKPAPFSIEPIGEPTPNLNLNEIAACANVLTGVYQSFQEKMERYWCLRALQQHLDEQGADSTFSMTLRRRMRYPTLVFDHLPLTAKLSHQAMETLLAGNEDHIQVRVTDINEWLLSVNIVRVNPPFLHQN